MKTPKVVKVTYHYTDGSFLECAKERDAWNEMCNIEWIKSAKTTAAEKRKERKEIFERLSKIDPNIFPENLFNTEEG